MITIQTRFAVCVQTAVLLYFARYGSTHSSDLRALRCVEEACRIPSRFYRDLEVAAAAHSFVEYWMLHRAQPKERPGWLALWIKGRRPES